MSQYVMKCPVIGVLFLIRSSLLSVSSGLAHYVFVFVLIFANQHFFLRMFMLSCVLFAVRLFAEKSRVCTCNIRHV